MIQVRLGRRASCVGVAVAYLRAAASLEGSG